MNESWSLPSEWAWRGEDHTGSVQYLSAFCPQTHWGLCLRVDSSGGLGQAHQHLPPHTLSWGSRVPVAPMPKVTQHG